MTEPSDPDVLALLRTAQDARIGRDRWRAVGPVLTQLVDRGVSFQTIEEMTGISSGTAHHHVKLTRKSRTPDRQSSEEES
jgi:hypothetical protein